MNVADDIRVHQARCQPYLLQLRILSGEQAGGAPARQVAAQIAQVAEAILAEVEATGQLTLTATMGGRRGHGATALLQARRARLRAAAHAATAAAWEEDAARLRHQIRRFEALTSAMWTVWYAVSDPVPRAGSSVRPVWHSGR
jgi:hypothetical protein